MNNPVLLSPEHFYLRHACDIDDLLTPLKRFGISTLTYVRNYSNLRQIYISNNPHWTEEYYKSALYGQFITKPPNKYETGCLIIPPDSPLPVHRLAREKFDTNYAAAFIKPTTKYTDFYFFAGTNSTKYVINLYINHRQLFEKFILYFQDRGEKLIAAAEKYKIILPNPSGTCDENFERYLINSDDIDKALNEMRVRKYKLKSKNDNPVTISARELDVITCLFKGMSAKKSGAHLNISHRTVETYIENVKQKLDCYSKIEILDILRKNDFPFHS